MSPSSYPSLARVLALVLGAFVAAPPAWAHRVSSVSLIAHLDTQKRTYLLDAAMEVVPSEDPAVNDQISPEDAAREFADYLVVRFDEADQKPELEIEVVEASDEDTPPELRREQVLSKLSGTIPEGAKEFLLYLDPRCPMAVVMVVVKDRQPSRRMQVILSGEYSRPVSVAPLEEGDPFAQGAQTEEPTPGGGGGGGEAGPAETPSRPGAGTAFAAGFVAFFAGSPLPALLAVAILLLTLGRSSAVRQAAALLAAMAPVLALSVSRTLAPSPWATEVCGLLVALVALEALFHHHVRWWRLPLLAVAGAALGGVLGSLPQIRTLALADSGLVAPLLLPLGAASALLLSILAAAAVLLPLGGHSWYRQRVVAPLAILASGLGGFFALERFL